MAAMVVMGVSGPGARRPADAPRVADERGASRALRLEAPRRASASLGVMSGDAALLVEGTR
jgi:hypothetical protein